MNKGTDPNFTGSLGADSIVRSYSAVGSACDFGAAFSV
jgi:hypothetical protein